MLRVYLAAEERGSVLAALSHLSQFFTILTNAIVLIVMVAIACGRRLYRGVLEVVTIAILGVGALYHVLLAHLWSPQGLTMLADQGVHTIVPLLSIVWWLVFADVCSARWTDSLRGIAWPMVYVLYALLRATFTNFYPYPFLNLPELGWHRLAANVAGVLIVFVLLGLALVAVARLRCRHGATALPNQAPVTQD